MTASGTSVLTPDQAADLVADGDVVAVSGCVWNMVPEHLCAALEDRFLRTGRPHGLTEYHLHIYGLGPDTGLEHFAHEGLTTRVIGGSFAPPYWFKGSRMAAMVAEDRIETFVLPAGVIAAMFRERAAGRPGVLTRIGAGTFVDPEHGGGRMNDRARTSNLRTVEWVEVAGEHWLYYPARSIDVSFLRGTYADEDGNVTFEHETMSQSVVEQAMATRASGGKVIVQVKRIVERGSLDPRLVRLPSIFVDGVVPVGNHPQFDYGAHDDSPGFSGELRIAAPEPILPPTSAATYVARRALREIQPGQTVNLGAGIPALAMPRQLWETGLVDDIDVTVEHGSWGGLNLGGTLAATHINPAAIMDSDTTFDLYTGGGLDIAFLGAAQVDGQGNVNVAQVGDTVVGVGGFIDIAQSARKVVFCSTLRRSGLEVAVDGGMLRIVQEGRDAKFVEQVELVCCAGQRAIQQGQEILFVTERAVFQLGPGGLMLTEVAPGIDVHRDVLDAVDCDVHVSDTLVRMDPAIFGDELDGRMRTTEPA